MPTSEEFVAEVSDNASMEYVECSSYFAIVQQAFLRSGNAATAAKYEKASDQAASFAVIAAQTSRSTEMAGKVTIARIESSLKDMMRTIENNYSNIALLSSKYSDSCVEAMTDSDALLKRWAEKITAKYARPGRK